MCWLGCVLRRFISNIRIGEISDSEEWCTWGTGCMRPLRGDLEGQKAAWRYWGKDLGEEMPELCEQQQMSLPHCPSPSPSLVSLSCWMGNSASLQKEWRRQWHPTPVLLPGKSHGWRSLIGCSPWVAKSQTLLSDFPFTFHFHALEKEMETHSSVLAWRIPGTGEPDRLPSTGSHRVGHDWSDLAAAAERKTLWDTSRYSLMLYYFTLERVEVVD